MSPSVSGGAYFTSNTLLSVPVMPSLTPSKDSPPVTADVVPLGADCVAVSAPDGPGICGSAPSFSSGGLMCFGNACGGMCLNFGETSCLTSADTSGACCFAAPVPAIDETGTDTTSPAASDTAAAHVAPRRPHTSGSPRLPLPG